MTSSNSLQKQPQRWATRRIIMRVIAQTRGLPVALPENLPKKFLRRDLVRTLLAVRLILCGASWELQLALIYGRNPAIFLSGQGARRRARFAMRPKHFRQVTARRSSVAIPSTSARWAASRSLGLHNTMSSALRACRSHVVLLSAMFMSPCRPALVPNAGRCV